MLAAETVSCQTSVEVAMGKRVRTPQGALSEVNVVEHDGADWRDAVAESC